MDVCTDVGLCSYNIKFTWLDTRLSAPRLLHASNTLQLAVGYAETRTSGSR